MVNLLRQNGPMVYRPVHHRPAAKAVAQSTLAVDGLEVHVTRKSAMRNMYLRVKPPTGRIEVSAPARVRDSEIARFVRGRAEWIEAQRQRIRDSLKETESRPAEGAFYGTAGGTNGDGRSTNATTFWTEARKLEAASRINAQLPALLAHWEPVVGRKPTHITLRLMTSRWGSCTPRTGRIRLNLQLGIMDPKFLEYVLVHEMTHLWENGHGAGFQRRMTAYLPRWRQLRRELNQQVVW